MNLKKGSDVELTIDSAAFKGAGVGRVGGIAVFVPGTAPGDRVKARILKKKKRHLHAKLLEVLEASPDRIEPKCSHADVCGGCTWQHLPYSVQLRIKQQQVQDQIERIAGLDPSIVLPVLGCEQPFHYRNKMEYSFGTRRWLTEKEIRSEQFVDDTGFAAGLHAPGRFDKILDLQECHLQDPVSYRILDRTRAFCIEKDIPPFDTVERSGYLRHLVVRNAFHTDDLMVNLVTYRDDLSTAETIAEELLKEFPQITTIVNNVNDLPNPTAVGRYEHVIHGPGTIVDRIGRYRFRIAANAFFQTNTLQAELLYRTVLNRIPAEGVGLLYDLYCGVGTLSLFLSERASRVVGIELSGTAVRNAAENAKANGVTHVEFHEGEMREVFRPELMEETGRPDLVVIDPPRSGMHPDVVSRLTDLAAPRLIYVSCNPSTLARDLALLKERYRTESVQPVDMFPQTYHIEAVAELTLKT